jgi:hypothetical protein
LVFFWLHSYSSTSLTVSLPGDIIEVQLPSAATNPNQQTGPVNLFLLKGQ